MLLQEITGVRLPVILLEDNTGAIFLVKNQQVGAKTKHIDVGHHFIRELHEEESLIVKYMESRFNEADMMTKNLQLELFLRHCENVRLAMMICYVYWAMMICYVYWHQIVAEDWREDVKT